MEDDAVRLDGASSVAPSDRDCEVVHAPGVGTSLAAHEARAPALGHLPGDPFVGAEERRIWEAFHDLLLTLLIACVLGARGLSRRDTNQLQQPRRHPPTRSRAATLSGVHPSGGGA